MSRDGRGWHFIGIDLGVDTKLDGDWIEQDDGLDLDVFMAKRAAFADFCDDVEATA